jgi:4-amino-4-deoxy-L-arabinose transferase
MIRRLTAVAIALVAAYLATLGMRPLLAPDEIRYAEVSREMVASGDWVVPHYVGLRYFEKPVLGYWVNALSQLAFGESNFAVRFPSAICALATAVLVALQALRARRERAVGLAAGVIYLSLLLVFLVGTTSVLDNLLALCTTAAMLAYRDAACAPHWRGRLLAHAAFGACCGVGFLTKGGVALAIPAVAIVPYMLWRRRWREMVIGGLGAAAVAALVVLPWALAIAEREPDFWRYFVWEEHIRRFASADAQHAQPVWFFVPVLIAGAMPWTFALRPALRRVWSRAGAVEREWVVYTLLWAVVPFLFFSVARGKLGTYVLPCCAPLAALLALGLTTDSRKPESVPAPRGAAWSNVALPILLVAAVLSATLGSRAPVFSPAEWMQPAAMVGALLAWAALAMRVVARPRAAALSTFACMPLPLMLVLPFVHPVSGAAGMTPVPFVADNADAIARDAAVVSDGVALAGALAWTLRREDITLLDASGELTYGLSYADAAGRRVDGDAFPSWLARERTGHDVALFTDKDVGASVPGADRVVTRGPYTLRLYLRRDGPED